MLIEDESLVRAITVQALIERGYRVLEATGGEVTRDLAAQHEGDIDLVLTNVVLPKMSGREIADELKLRYSDLKVLFMSGYTEDAIIHHDEIEPGISFLPKPFTPGSLTRKLRSILDQASEVGTSKCVLRQT